MRWLAGLLALCLVPPLAAQGVHVHMEHLGVPQGLLQSSGRAVAQGPDGYLWFGTEGGLQRYDGYRFVNYFHVPGQPDSLSADQVLALAVGPDRSVWVSTHAGGLDRLKPDRSGFEHYVHDDDDAGSLANKHVLALLVDRDQRLWVAGDEGVERLLPDGRFKHYGAGRGKGPRDDESYALMQDRGGRLWASSRAGPMVLDVAADRLRRFEPAAGSDAAAVKALQTSFVTSFAQDRQGRIWVGTYQAGVFVLSPQGRIAAWLHQGAKPGKSLATNWVTALREDRNGTMWVGLSGQGLVRMDPNGAGWKLTRIRHDPSRLDSLSSDKIMSLFSDATGLLWIGTYDGAFSIYNPRSRAFGMLAPGHADVPGLDSRIIWNIRGDGRDHLWVATQTGVVRVNRRSRKMQTFNLPGVHVPEDFKPIALALLVDADGSVWVGTDAGLFRRAAGGGLFTYVDLGWKPGDDPAKRYVSGLLRDRQGRLWVATQWGLLQLDPASGNVLHRYPPGSGEYGLPMPFVSAMCQSADGQFWVGTPKGMRRFDADQARYEIPKVSGPQQALLTAGTVMGCLADPDGSLWIGGSNGLLHFWPQSGRLQVYSTADGLPARTVFSLLRDAHGGIWLATARGLARLDVATGTIQAYGMKDGVSNQEFNQWAAFTGSDGMLYFGGAHGVTTVDPALLNAHEAPQARVEITGYGLGEEKVGTRHALPASGILAVDYKYNTVSLGLALLNYADPARNGFRYRLEGFDPTWHQLHGSHDLTYTNLDAGLYTLRVQGIDSKGRSSANDAVLVLDIETPPWQRWWAWAIYVLAALLVLTLSLRLFALWLRRRRDLVGEQRRRRSAEAFNALIQALSRLDDESAMLTQFMQRVPALVQHDALILLNVSVDGWVKIATHGLNKAGSGKLQTWLREYKPQVDGWFATGQPVQLNGEDVCAKAKACLVIPFGQTNGSRYLLAVTRQNHAFSSAERDQAQSVARQVGLLLERARLIRLLKVQASTDALTGINNRRAFLELAEVEFSRSQRQLYPVAVLLMDLDHFKRVNDSHGHAVGDVVLTSMVERCRSQLRASDSMGRYGGEEFVVCLPETSLPAALVLAERLRAQVGDQPMQTPAGTIKSTISIGVASIVPGPEDSLPALIAKADEALYEAKRTGRNRVHGAGLDECTA